MVNFSICEICGCQLITANSTNANKFPAVRKHANDDEKLELISVRCAECERHFPYKLASGQAYRTHRIGLGEVQIISDWNSEYRYLSNGIGHLLEILVGPSARSFLPPPDEDNLSVGFLVDDLTGAIIIGNRFGSHDWTLTPYYWQAYPESVTRLPPSDPTHEEDRVFNIAYVDDLNGVYLFVHRKDLSYEFARAFHAAIIKQARSEIHREGNLQNQLFNLYLRLNENKEEPFVLVDDSGPEEAGGK